MPAASSSPSTRRAAWRPANRRCDRPRRSRVRHPALPTRPGALRRVGTEEDTAYDTTFGLEQSSPTGWVPQRAGDPPQPANVRPPRLRLPAREGRPDRGLALGRGTPPLGGDEGLAVQMSAPSSEARAPLRRLLIAMRAAMARSKAKCQNLLRTSSRSPTISTTSAPAPSLKSSRPVRGLVAPSEVLKPAEVVGLAPGRGGVAHRPPLQGVGGARVAVALGRARRRGRRRCGRSGSSAPTRARRRRRGPRRSTPTPHCRCRRRTRTSCAMTSKYALGRGRKLSRSADST